MNRDSSFCAKSVKYNIFANGAPYPFLFNIYISDLPTTVSRKYTYADDLAIMHADGDWQLVEGC